MFQSVVRNTQAAAFPRSAFDLVVIAASAGGVGALQQIVARLSVPFPAPLGLVLHLPANRDSALAQVLGTKARLWTRFARDGERLRAGTVFIAPPDRHLVIGAAGECVLEDSPKCCHVRPAADRLFGTAAARFGPRLLAVVLTGAGCDGAAGAQMVKQQGGVLIVQDPESAEHDGMPRAALRATSADLILPLTAIPSALNSLCEVIGTRELFCGGTSLAAAVSV